MINLVTIRGKGISMPAEESSLCDCGKSNFVFESVDALTKFEKCDNLSCAKPRVTIQISTIDVYLKFIEAIFNRLESHGFEYLNQIDLIISGVRKHD